MTTKLYPLTEFTGYSIDKSGRVYSHKTNMYLTPFKNNYGYFVYGLRQNGKEKQIGRARLLALQFINNPDNKPQVNHIDGDKTNDTLPNLEWVTSKENIQHSFRMGLQPKQKRGEDNPLHKLTDNSIKEILRCKGMIPQKTLARIYGVDQSLISRIYSGERRVAS